MKKEIVALFTFPRDQKQAAGFASGLLTGEAVRSLTIRKKQVHRSPKIDAWVVIAFKTAPPQSGGAGTSVRIPMAASFVLKRGLKVIGSSEQVHMVDALAITGDEGRSSLR